ncbi:MAG: Unknown protein [uncultured Sulfurovum sp.]|uniref:TerB family tellurite resistance protein n=1 Tax=uncultured Sulfurovum sp. TaxID=269237 RepID=A0A6S6SG18_9BACT|nr:MAG: Unknown protein [uncultured Sulfurovum sp.]
MSFLSKLSNSVFGIFNKDTKEENKEVKEVLQEKLKIEEKVETEEKIEPKEEVKVLSEIDALKKELSSTFNNLTSMEEYWEAIVAIEAVATSCASSDKNFSDKEREKIKTFIQKINPNKEVPSSIKEKIDEIYVNPLPLNKAFLLAKDTKVEMSVFEDIIDVVMHTDGVKFEEKVVLQAWHDFKQSA